MLFFFFGGKDLLQDASNEAARWIMYIGFAIFLPGFMLLLTLWRREMRVLGLKTAGSTIRGRVVSMKKDRLSQGYVLEYGFNDSMGRTYQGKELLFQQEAFTWREGEEVEILYDPNDPTVSVWVGRTDDHLGESQLINDDVRETASSAVIPAETPVLPPASFPSSFTLFRRCIPMRRALANFVWVLFYGLFLLGATILAAEQPSKEGWLVLIVGSLALLAFFLFGVVRNWIQGVRQLREWRRLLDNGSPVGATVTLVEEKRERWGRWTWKPGWIVSYRYTDPNGRFRYGDSGYLSRKEAADWRTEDKCMILYDPGHPEKNVWIGKT